MADLFATPQSVSSLNQKIKSLIEATFLNVLVEGEVSNLTCHNSGHYYFSIKDSQSAIKCVLFRGNVASGLNFELKNTQKVQIIGHISVYVPRGEYQIICSKIMLAGQGAEEFEKMKARLSAKGYFDSSHKKALPKFPKKIALITSNTGAALQDMLRVAMMRWQCIKIVNYDTLVQGVEASRDIARNIKRADSLFGSHEAFDVIIIARGGGSTEDLWAFNQEEVAEAIFEARTPVVSAIGHEIDYVISDFVADMRAPTPSAAMEMVLPDSNTWLLYIDELYESLDSVFKHHIEAQEKEITHLGFLLGSLSFDTRLKNREREIEDLKKIFTHKMEQFLESKKIDTLALKFEVASNEFIKDKEKQLHEISLMLRGKNLTKLCENGYAQILYEGKPIDIEKLDKDSHIEIVSTKALLKAVVEDRLPNF